MTERSKGISTEARIAIVVLAIAAIGGCSSRVIRESGTASVVQPSKPKYGATAVVRRGDTLYRIASSNGIAVRDLAAWNGIAEPYTIQPGQRLKLYPATGSRPSTSTAGTTVTSKSATPPRTPTSGKPKPATPVAPVAPSIPSSSGFNWRWPADGDLIGRYVAGDPTKQGVDIAGNGGAAVRAAADGVVVYSGSGLVGYGELVIIKHSEQWLSAYGHNRSRLVNEGQLVKAGEQIAEMGRSGAARDMLHFEVRYNGKPVDPLLYLPRR
ncbi:lipoprotein NlpD [Lysobacter niastensis]|uniref:Lipoprotein NlpD n=1 Tax=Lysobacter niastensis TaxID=380629 RepID=A0ABU1WAV4_9GAMM|nr:peptidoglycan DD-metalloendopeptidase family protein [Lysobacter niastensis]MDR7134674.1 lipoprotein NlpD [Lysobacter niastensis]